MNNRGQVALEFIFIMVIIVIYLFTVTRPVTDSAKNYLGDVEKMTRASNETQKLSNSIERISLLATGSQEKIMLFVPNDTNIYCYPGKVGYSVTLGEKPYPPQCASGSCDKNFPTPNGITITCGITDAIVGQRAITIQKSGETTITIAG